MNSPFTSLGIGIVSEDKPSGEVFATVFLLEQSQLAGQEINKEDKKTINIKLANGKSKQLSVKEDFRVKAKWLKSGDSNRITPPELVNGQYVQVLQKPGYDEYYWVKIFDELDMATQEAVTYAWAAKPKESKSQNFLEESYRLSVDTIEGEIRLVTSKANNEATTYTILIDTKNGQFGLEDGEKNAFYLDSTKGTFNVFLNKDNSLKVGENTNTLITKNHNEQVDGEYNLQIKDALTMSAKQIDSKIKGKVNLDTSDQFNLKIVKEIQAKTMSDIKIQANKGMQFISNTESIDIISPKSVSIMAPTINLVGNVMTPSVACGALAIGGAAPTPPQVNPPQMDGAKLDKLKDAVKVIEEATKQEDDQKNGQSGGGGGKKSASPQLASAPMTISPREEEEEDDPWKDEAQPPKGEQAEEPTKSVCKGEKPMEMSAPSILIDGKQGLSLKGGNSKDLTEIITDAVTQICTLIDTPVPVSGAGTGTCSTGPVATVVTATTQPPGTGATVANLIKTLLTAFKGSAGSTYSLMSDSFEDDLAIEKKRFRAKSLGIPFEEPKTMDVKTYDELLEEIKHIISEHKKNVEEIMNKTLEEQKSIMNEINANDKE